MRKRSPDRAILPRAREMIAISARSFTTLRESANRRELAVAIRVIPQAARNRGSRAFERAKRRRDQRFGAGQSKMLQDELI